MKICSRNGTANFKNPPVENLIQHLVIMMYHFFEGLNIPIGSFKKERSGVAKKKPVDSEATGAMR